MRSGAAGRDISGPRESSGGGASNSASRRPWWGDNPQLETKVPQLLQSGTPSAAAEARALLLMSAEEEAPISQFFLGCCTGVLEGEAAAIGHYERALQQLPLLHSARNNLIRGLMKRGSAADRKSALEHAKLSAGLQPDVAEMQYQLGVVQMQLGMHGAASASFEGALRLDAAHHGAYINGVHCLQQLPPSDKAARRRLEKLAKMGVAHGLWTHHMQRPPHLVRKLRSKPWWDARDFEWCAMLERSYEVIREEVLRLRSGAPQSFTPVGGRAAHDHTLVAAGEWREFPLFGNGQAYAANCARCPRTAAALQGVPAALELALSGLGETLFSTLKPGTHLRPHCGSTNTRLTCHLGIIVPEGCSIRAGDEWREWHEGECLVFDDSWEHEVQHRGDADRVVLLINFWHPDLAPHERRVEINTHGYETI